MPPSKLKEEQSDQDSYSENESGQDQDKVMIKKPKVQRLDNMKNLKKIIINVSMTQYPVVIEVAEQLGWKIQHSSDAGDWDIFWTDWHIEPDVLIKMHLFQKISHYPGIHTLARKNLLGMNLMSMRSFFPQEYNFFPLTWMLPQQYVQFRTYFESRPKGKARTYIAKPQADCQGRGIFLTRKIEFIQNGKHYVIQRYLSRPYLIDGLKFDMRIYVLIGSVNPLRIYLFQDGLARFATQPYIQPTSSNLQKQYMHLTNYAINKKNPKFIFNNNASNMGSGHKRSLICVMKQLEVKGVNIQQLRTKIKDLIIKTIITGLPIMSHQYKCSQPQDYTGNMCFHILGFDVMLKSNAEPVLLEVNHTPSFTTDTPLDFKIKKALIKDTLNIMNVNVNKKAQLYNLCVENNQARLLTGKRNILEGKARQQLIAKHQKERQQYEKNSLGGYELIYPSKSQERMNVYEQLIDHCNKQHFEEKSGPKMKIAQKEAKRLAREEYRELKNKQKQQKLKDKSKTNESKQNQQNKQSTEQTSSTNLTKSKVGKKIFVKLSSSQPQRNYQKKRTIDNSQISIGRESTQRTNKLTSTNPRYTAHHRQVKTQSQKIVCVEEESTTRTSNIMKEEQPKTSQRRIPTPTKYFIDRNSQLPFIIEPPTQMPSKSNLIIGKQFDHRRYIKGSATIIEKQIVQRSISGKTQTMAKSTSAVRQQKEDIQKRQNLSGLMARKRFEDKINDKKKLLDTRNYPQTRKDVNKICYTGFSSSYNPMSLNECQNNGQFVMPKIFSLNFQNQKGIDANMKFLLFKNIEANRK